MDKEMSLEDSGIYTEASGNYEGTMLHLCIANMNNFVLLTRR